MRTSSVRAAWAGYIAVALTPLLAAGCAASHSVIPNAAFDTPARVVSTIVKAGPSTYVVDEMHAPTQGYLAGVTRGPSGDVWFAGYGFVGRSTATGDMTLFATPGYSGATSIAEGPDQNLWVTLLPAAIGRVTTGGGFTAFPIPRQLGGAKSYPSSITKGPADALWFLRNAARSAITRIDTSGQFKVYPVTPHSRLESLAMGADGALWFTDSGTNKVGRMGATGSFIEFPVPTANAGLFGICPGPDGKMWFLEDSAHKIASVTSAGTFEEYDIPPSAIPNAIVAGSDGALWFTDLAGKIGRITTAGSVVELKVPAPSGKPLAIASGSDKNIWFTGSQANGILARVDLTEVPDSDPTYSAISLSLSKVLPELGVPGKLPLSITVANLYHHVVKGNYPNPVFLTTTDPKYGRLSAASVRSSDSPVSVLFSGHYTDAVIGANAAGGATINPATIALSLQPEKALPSPGYGITRSTDGSLWICLANGSIAKYTKGSLNVYPATTNFESEGCSMVEGPDGNVWFTDYTNDRIGKITPTGTVTFVQLAHDASPFAIALGSDGALWFTESFPGRIGRLTTSGQLRTFYAGSSPSYIVAGPDGNLWYERQSIIYKVTTSGKITRVRAVFEMGGGGPWSADQHLWFYSVKTRSIAEMATSGNIVNTFAVPENCFPSWLTGGPENSLWYVDASNNCVARMTLSGKFSVVSTYSHKQSALFIAQMVVGKTGFLWFTETGNNGLGWIDPSTI